MKELSREQDLQLCIDQLESGCLSVRDSEDMLFSFMFSYLHKFGYEFEHAPAASDSLIDFIGVNKGALTSDKIGVIYKHSTSAIDPAYVEGIVNKDIGLTVDRVIIVTNSRFSEISRKKYRDILPTDIELVDIEHLRSWSFREKKVKGYDLTIVNSLRKSLSDALIKLIAANPRYLEDIEWRELERVVQTVFEALGFSSELTPGEKDGGKDIVLRCKVENAEHTYYVELKHWRSKQRVGGAAASQFINVIVNEGISGGLFLSTYGYCDNAFEMISKIDRKLLKFGSEDKIVSLCRQYVLSQSLLWEPVNVLEDVLFSTTV